MTPLDQSETSVIDTPELTKLDPLCSSLARPLSTRHTGTVEAVISNPDLSNPKQPRPSNGSILPDGDDKEAVLVRRYMRIHRCANNEQFFVSEIADALSSVLRARIEIIGCHGDGSASLKDSLTLVTLGLVEDIGKERSEVLQDIKAAGPSRGWKARSSPSATKLIEISPLDRRGTTVFLIVDYNLSLMWSERTQFVKLYAGSIEPRIRVTMSLVRELLLPELPDSVSRHALDYYIFTLIWRSLVVKRLIPNLLYSDNAADGVAVHDAEIWSHIPSSRQDLDELRSRWRVEGIGVAAWRASVRDMMSHFLEFTRIWLNPEQVLSECPLTGVEIFDEGVSCTPGRCMLLHAFWRAVCMYPRQSTKV